MITEILEEDFRRLGLYGYQYDKGSFREVRLNDILTENIEYWINNGYESDLEDLKKPVTIAIHNNYTEPNLDNCYFDKYMNRFSGPKTFELGMGINHIYSTRDYYEAHEDYWRVRKNETKVVYRIHLNPKWLDKFVLKHKTVIEEKFDDNHYIQAHYDLENGEWTLSHRTEVIKTGNSTEYKPL